jgi:DNA-binding NtrC family response regulator
MPGTQRLRVLVVDGDEGSNVELKDLLTEQGYQAHVVTEPARAIDEIRGGRFHLVLLDVSPPDDAAVELLTRIRALDSDVCTIAMTESPSVPGAVRALKRHAYDYLQKPVEPTELCAVIEAAIEEKGLLADLELRLNHVVGGRLRERRQAAQLTLKQLANRTGLSVSLISQIELGKSAASMSTLHKLATALQVKMTYFFETV